MFKTISLPYDIYERHRRVGEFIGSRETVLDVGGQLNLLSYFCNAEKITVANVSGSQENSDVEIKGDRLPFKSNSFEVVCAIDVLEHIKSTKRQSFIKDLMRVAEKKVIISFPLGTQSHIEYEKKLQKVLSQKGLDVTYLNEHIKFGLPTPGEVNLMTSGFKLKKYYSGDSRINYVLFNLFIFDPKIKYIRKIIYLLKLIFNLVTNPVFYSMLSNKKFSSSVNRMYLSLEK